jgi:RNA polymerase sigma-70 factor (ECF subfamily)
MLNEKIHTIPFNALHAHLKGMIERYAFYLTRDKQNIEDISQDIFLKLWLKWPRLSGLDEAELEDYIYIMVKNHVVNIGKKIVVKRKYLNYYKAAGSETCWHDEVLLADGLRVYRAAINCLPPKERKVYQFHDIDYDRSQIASIVQRSEHTIRNQLWSASKTVKTFLNKNFDLNIQEDGRRKLWKVSLN